MAGENMGWGRRTSEEEERGIQALLDEALGRGPQPPLLKPLNLEMRNQRDLGVPEPSIRPGATLEPSSHSARYPQRGESPVPGADRSTSRISGAPPFHPPSQIHRAGAATTHSRVRRARFIRPSALMAFLIVLLIGLGLLSFTPPQHSNPASLMEDVACLHAAGDFQGALRGYAVLRQSGQDITGFDSASLAFLEAGAAENLWKQGINAGENFELALRCYEDAIQFDQTPMRVYGSEALMAKAEMNVAKALAGQPDDVSAALTARQSLETLVESPEYSTSPAVELGLAHRRLAELIRVEDPQKAISLLTLSRDRQGSFAEGSEDLLIARIYRDIVRDDDRAFEFYTLVKNNPLASKANRRASIEALAGINGTDLQATETLDTETLENLPQLKAD